MKSKVLRRMSQEVSIGVNLHMSLWLVGWVGARVEGLDLVAMVVEVISIMIKRIRSQSCNSQKGITYLHHSRHPLNRSQYS